MEGVALRAVVTDLYPNMNQVSLPSPSVVCCPMGYNLNHLSLNIAVLITKVVWKR